MNHTIKNLTRSFLLSIFFLMIIQGSLFGQFIRLDHSVDGGGTDDFITPCLENQANSIFLTIESICEDEFTIEINDIFVDTQPSNPLLGAAINGMDFNDGNIPLCGLGLIDLQFMHDWETYDTNGIIFNLTIDYTIIDSDGTETLLFFEFDPFIIFMCEDDNHSDNGDDTPVNTGGPIRTPVKTQFNDKYQNERFRETESDLNTIKSSVKPNPTLNNFQIEYQLEKESFVKIDIYNGIGQKIKSICEHKLQKEGEYMIENQFSEENPKGIYYLVYQIGDSIHTEKIVKL